MRPCKQYDNTRELGNILREDLDTLDKHRNKGSPDISYVKNDQLSAVRISALDGESIMCMGYLQLSVKNTFTFHHSHKLPSDLSLYTFD